MKIGELQERNVNGRKLLIGLVSTLTFTMAIELQPAPPSDNPNAPSFVILGKSISGARVAIGAAWAKQMKRGANAGEEFLTITIDDPSLPRALNLAAFRKAESGEWEIMFRRRQERAA